VIWVATPLTTVGGAVVAAAVLSATVAGVKIVTRAASATRGHSQAQRAWTGAAAKLRLRRDRSVLGGDQMGGEYRGCQVFVRRSAKGAGTFEVVYEVTSPRIPRDLHVVFEGFGAALSKSLRGTPDTPVNDPEFDELALVQGRESEVVALMNEENRAGVKRLVLEGGTLTGQTLTLTRTGTMTSSNPIVSAVRDLVELARDLQGPRPISRALARNALKDPLCGVRLRNLLLLIDQHPDNPVVQDTARQLVDDPDGAVRMVALAWEGDWRRGHKLYGRHPVGDDGLVVLARAATNSGGSDAGDVLLKIALSAGVPPRPRNIAITTLLHQEDPRLLSQLTGLVDLDESVAKVVATVLADLSDPVHEPTLVKLLDHDAIAVRLAAIEGLGVVGSIQTVGLLLPLTSGVFTQGRLKRASSRAIRQIQVRSGVPQGGGQLSVVDPQGGGGALSRAEPEGGQVSPAGSRPARVTDPGDQRR